MIIPTYNRSQMVQEAIDSVLEQDFTDYELIVVDDGSNDNTPEILAGYGQRIKVLHQSNKGVSAARNFGIAAASGQLIALLDSDDLWLPRKLATQVTFFEDNPIVVINQTQERWIRKGRQINPKQRHHKFSVPIRMFITSGSWNNIGPPIYPSCRLVSPGSQPVC